MTDILTSRAERLLVCIGPSPHSAELINSVSRMAASLNAKWFAVYVETPKTLMLSEEERNRAADNLRLAERMGAEAYTLNGRNVAEEIAEFARLRNITRIVVGKPRDSHWNRIFFRSPVDQMVLIGG